MDYTIALWFISWVMAIIFITGFWFMQVSIADLKKNQDDDINEMFLKDYYNQSPLEKFRFIFFIGAKFIALTYFDIKKGDE